MTQVKTPGGAYQIDIPQETLDAAVASAEKHGVDGEPGAPADQPEEEPAAITLEVATEAPAAAPAPARKSPQDAIIEALLKGKQEATEALKQTQKEAKDLMEARARTQAEFENFKKRVNKDKQEAANMMATRMAKELLPVMDNFDRILLHVDMGKIPDDVRTVLQGVTLVSKQMGDAFKKVGIISFDSKGSPFDPARHEAVNQVPAPEGVEVGSVLEELQKGYMLGEQLLRPALVVVAGPREG